MPFGVVWSGEAEADFDAIAGQHPVAASQILDQIDLLAEDPVAVARRPSFPNPLLPKHQFWVNAEGGRLYVTVLFRYLPGEKDIEIRAIGRQFVSDDDPYPFA